MQSSSSAARSNMAFELKGSLFTLTVLHLLSVDLNVFIAQLRKHAQKTPNLFKNMPLVIDLQRVNQCADNIDFVNMQHQLRQHGLIPVGIRHGNESQNHAAQAAGLALLSSQSTSGNNLKAKTKISQDKPTTDTAPHTLLITKPVRSGQQVYARNANLVVLSTVSHGAELLADGYIHVYGNLQGRALAGITGDKTARILCLRLEAELVSIAGYYKLRDDIPNIEMPVTQIYLQGEQIHIDGIAGKI
ncbi:MAG TPA: septum site-determining protein MinC [Gammaproteobacteria bacterium]|nr:septum site-determining protein MinC [Gammaproteobacteria bacterium]